MEFMSMFYGNKFDDDVRRHIAVESIMNAIQRFAGVPEKEINRCDRIINRISVSRCREVQLDPQTDLFIANGDWAGQNGPKFLERDINIMLKRTGKKHVHREAPLWNSTDPAKWKPQFVVANCKDGIFRKRFSQDKLICRLPVFPEKIPFICPCLKPDTPRISNHNMDSKTSAANGWKGYPETTI